MSSWCALSLAACAGAGDAGQNLPDTALSEHCVSCLSDQDCAAGAWCMRLAGETLCAPGCTDGGGCSTDRVCAMQPRASGEALAVCVPRSDLCGRVARGAADSSAGPIGDGGAPTWVGTPVTGSVGARGGHVSRLYFVVVGDTRPASIDDTSGYPSPIIAKIFQDVQSLRPAPLFGLSTGDYMFASTTGGQAALQLDLYLQARRRFSGVMFPTMGNHECTGYTTSNCGSGNADGVTDNYAQYLTRFMQPLGQSNPYYVVPIDDTKGAWTAKFVFVAANAWDGAQAAWLEVTLARPSTYTFVVRHEPSTAITAPGVSQAEQALSRYPYTLSIVGHSHTYARLGAREIIVGNGGAPLTSKRANYGFALIEQRPDRAIQVNMVDYATMRPDLGFTFAVKPDGSPAP